MCLTTGDADLKDTRQYAGIGIDPVTGEPLHVMGYQCVRQNRARGGKPNALVLFLPIEGSFGPENFLDMRAHRGVFTDLQEATEPRNTRSMGRRVPKGVATQVFTHDIYDVVLAEPWNIPDALEQVAPEKRPQISRDFLHFAADCRERVVVVCCFNEQQETEAAPLFLWYKSRYPDVLVAPAVDGHTGDPPRDEMVDVDHQLFVGTAEGNGGGHRVTYKTPLPEHLRPFLPQTVDRQEITGRLQNGDFTFPAWTVKFAGAAGEYRRVMPTQAPWA